jgi:hypothetical protein
MQEAPAADQGVVLIGAMVDREADAAPSIAWMRRAVAWPMIQPK